MIKIILEITATTMFPIPPPPSTVHKSAYNQPIGPPVSSTPSPYASNKIALKGQYITLVPFEAKHTRSLWQNLDFEGDDEQRKIATYLPHGLPMTWEGFEELGKGLESDNGYEVWAICRKRGDVVATDAAREDGKGDAVDDVLGCIAYLNISPANRELEIGAVIFSKALQRTVAAYVPHTNTILF